MMHFSYINLCCILSTCSEVERLEVVWAKQTNKQNTIIPNRKFKVGCEGFICYFWNKMTDAMYMSINHIYVFINFNYLPLIFIRTKIYKIPLSLQLIIFLSHLLIHISSFIISTLFSCIINWITLFLFLIPKHFEVYCKCISKVLYKVFDLMMMMMIAIISTKWNFN